MDEQQVRMLVRQAIARHLGPQAEAGMPMAPAAIGPSPSAPAAAPPMAGPLPVIPAAAIAHARFALVRAAGEVECVIEPAVACNHCGYCQCYGH